jgi:hypothetical protein
MLRIKLLVTALLLISFSISAQNYWKPETLTSFSVQSNTQVTSFVDASGIHIAYYRNGGIKYALVNSNGGAVNGKYDKVIEVEGAGTNYANIVAIDNNVYVFYLKNNRIQMAKSTNLGDTWNNNFDYWQMSNFGCDAITGYLVGQEIHIVWTETRINDYQPETHYIKFVPTGQIKWQNYYKVTDVETQGGNNPDVAISTDKVHVDYIPQYPLNPKSRTRLSNGTWDTPQFVPYFEFPMASLTNKVKPIITGSNLNEIYRANYGTIGVSGSYIGHSYRPLNSSTWVQNPDIINTVANKSHLVEKTADNKIHIISFDAVANNYVHRTINGTTISGIIATVPFYELTKKLVSNSNDLYLLHAGNTSIPYPIFFRHYDAAPLAPSNLTISINASDETVLTWIANTEPDVRIINGKYNIYRAETDINGNLLPYQLAATINAVNGSIAVNSWIDGDALKSTVRKLYYKITAVDINQHESLFSNIVWRFGRLGKTTSQNISNSEYELFDNYPNPFNPSTKISYSIKEEGLVTLKVFDILGKEIATLVNENKPAGIYEAEFNASQLPSGIYIYKIQAGNFTDVKKMLLTK